LRRLVVVLTRNPDILPLVREFRAVGCEIVAVNAIGSTSGSLASGTGDFSLITVTGLGIGAGNLGIRLAEVSGGQTLFDAVTLETVVPAPAAVWLFGSGLLGLFGISRRKKAA